MQPSLEDLIATGREEELYHRLFPLCRNAVRGIFVLSPIPEDFLHEASAMIVIASRRWKPGTASFVTFAYRRARSMGADVLDYRDAKKRKGITHSLDTDVSALVNEMPDPRFGVLRYAVRKSDAVEREKRARR